MSETTRTTATDHVETLVEAIEEGTFYRLRPCPNDPFPAWAAVPSWVPRSGYTRPTRAVLQRVEAGLRRKL